MLVSGTSGAVRWAFSDRRGGRSVSPYDALNVALHVGDDATTVWTNRQLLSAALTADDGGEPLPLVFMDQVHGASVGLVAVRPPAGPAMTGDAAVSETDGIVTRDVGVGLAVMVADCVPVLLADPVAGVVAAVHVGRPGLRARIIDRALDVMIEAGANPADMVAWLGPCVCAQCYEVPEAMRDDVAAVVPASWATSRKGTPALDLRAGLTARLEAVGADVHSVGPCTAESSEHFSYRREGVTGRFAGVVWLAS